MTALAPFMTQERNAVRTADRGSTAQGTVIDVSDLQFQWRNNGVSLLDIESLQVVQGERVFIEGPSGSGKSTLLSLVAGVVTPQHGTITVLGRRMDIMSGAERDRYRADHIGFIFQLFNLIPYLSVVENVTLPCRFSRLRREKALRDRGSLQAQALRLLRHLDLDDPDLLQRPVTELSVGQQQRVAAARALIGAPEVLIADEPTSSLDTGLRSDFINLLFEECSCEGTTLIFVSHDRALMHLFDRTIRLPEVNRVGGREGREKG